MEFKDKIPQRLRDFLESLAAIKWNIPRHRRQIAIGVAASLVLLISVGWMIATLHTPRPGNIEYFTIDDGKAYFALSGAHFPPFEYQGREAVKAIMFKGSDGKPFVGYLMKYSPEAQRAMASAGNGSASNGDSAADPLRDEDVLLKRPGDKQWLPSSDPKAPEIWGTATDPKTGAQAPPWNGP